MINYLWRALFACIFVVIFYVVLPIVMRIIGFSINGDIMTLIKIVVAVAALWYIVFGPPVKVGP